MSNNIEKVPVFECLFMNIIINIKIIVIINTSIKQSKINYATSNYSEFKYFSIDKLMELRPLYSHLIHLDLHSESLVANLKM